MRYCFFLFFLLSILPAFGQSFLPGTEDIPLLDGLRQVEETASFDNPSERMVLISAQTQLSRHEVLTFYRQTLANLGWKEKSSGKFERGNDTLFIEITSDGKRNQIQFRLSQRNL